MSYFSSEMYIYCFFQIPKFLSLSHKGKIYTFKEDCLQKIYILSILNKLLEFHVIYVNSLLLSHQ